ncbi:MAG: hypothetical protein K8I82_25620, partial [Anaerolineae bacterium]|nr:hypothetical protein [Anaerolineae bacterium]
VGAMGFVGYTFLQHQNEDKTPTPKTVAVTSPVATASTLLPACTVAQTEIAQTQIDAALNHFSQLPFMQDDSIESIQEFSTTVPLIESAVEAFYADTADLPLCAEGIHARHVIGLTMDGMTEFYALAVLTLYVEQNGDTATAEILRRAMNQRDTISDSTLARMETETDQGFQVCGDQAAVQLAPYQNLLDEYLSLYPAYESFMQTLSGDFATLFRYEELSVEILAIRNTPCYENIEIESQYAQLFLDTATAIHVAQLAAFEKIRGNPTTAAQLQAVAQEHQASADQLLAAVLAGN